MSAYRVLSIKDQSFVDHYRTTKPAEKQEQIAGRHTLVSKMSLSRVYLTKEALPPRLPLKNRPGDVWVEMAGDAAGYRFRRPFTRIVGISVFMMSK